MNYTVKAGDTLGKIAIANGITVAQIAAANGIANIDRITVGQVLTIPAAGVTLNATGQVVPDAAPIPTAKPTTNWVDGLTQLLAIGIPTAGREWTLFETAKADRKQRIANGLPVSDIRADEVATTQNRDANATVKTAVQFGFVALAALIAGALLFAPGEPQTRKRN